MKKNGLSTDFTYSLKDPYYRKDMRELSFDFIDGSFFLKRKNYGSTLFYFRRNLISDESITKISAKGYEN